MPAHASLLTVWKSNAAGSAHTGRAYRSQLRGSVGCDGWPALVRKLLAPAEVSAPDLEFTTAHPLTRSFSGNRLTAHGGLLSPAEAFVSRLGLTLDGKGGTQWRVRHAWW